MEAALAAPHTPSEDILARIWAEVLRLDRIGVNDNFFELGGDSIFSIQIVARANRRACGSRLGKFFSTRRSPSWLQWRARPQPSDLRTSRRPSLTKRN